ncbi:hypothetical protein M2G99_21320 [Vibrio vulnificus]|nr:hypothetical protein [Vibrio vulnificus]MCU8225625.1 hypothetical protein [Vibrio vulnificus]
MVTVSCGKLVVALSAP